MSGGERVKAVSAVKVMMQDAKGSADVGKIGTGAEARERSTLGSWSAVQVIVCCGERDGHLRAFRGDPG